MSRGSAPQASDRRPVLRYMPYARGNCPAVSHLRQPPNCGVHGRRPNVTYPSAPLTRPAIHEVGRRQEQRARMGGAVMKHLSLTHSGFWNGFLPMAESYIRSQNLSVRRFARPHRLNNNSRSTWRCQRSSFSHLCFERTAGRSLRWFVDGRRAAACATSRGAYSQAASVLPHPRCAGDRR